MKIFVTGGSGFIGSHSCVELLKDGHDLFLYDNFINSNPCVIKQIELISNKSIEYIEGDIRNYDLLCSLIKNFKPECVIHFAGLKSVSESMLNPLTYYDINVTGSLNLLRAMVVNSCKNIIFSSSATIYKSNGKIPYDETSELHPTSTYGNTKLIIEKILKDWVSSNKNNKAICLRYFNPVGAHNSGKIGENPKSEPNNIMPLIAEVATGKRKYINIYGNDYSTRDGTGERDYIHIMDLAVGHLEIVKKLDFLDSFEVFNLGTGKGTTVLELIETFQSVSKKLIPIRFVERRSGDVARSLANPKNFNKYFNLNFNRNLKEMCEDTWKWSLTNLNLKNK